jgi:hypothetical protein
MLVDEQFRKCVTFLYADRPANGGTVRVPIGSAFFVGVDIFDAESPGSTFAIHVVTARHVIDGPDVLWLRMRLKDGGFADIPVDPQAWIQHPTTDVAAAALNSDPAFDWVYIKWDQFATRELVTEKSVGEGDDVFFSGLFVGHYGESVPQPLIRFGNVALMPREPVRIEISKRPKTWAKVEAYLVEARSWGGQSGSPAFLSFPATRQMGGGVTIGGGPPFALLGLVQGIWKDEEAAKATDPSGEGVVEINMGISVVIPAYKIWEVLMDERLKGLRARTAEQMESSRGSLTTSEATSFEEDPG